MSYPYFFFYNAAGAILRAAVSAVGPYSGKAPIAKESFL